jgi:urease accessory protein
VKGHVVTTPRAVATLGTLALLAAGTPAHAHLMNTGFGPFYDGLTHLFVTPEDLLPVTALTLLAGLRGPRFGRTVLFMLPLAWLAASLAGFLFSPPAAAAAATAVLTIALGALAAADRPLPLMPVASITVLLGLVNGGLNGVELARAQQDGMAAAGVACALFVLVSLLSGQVTSLRAPWARIAARVAGSWIAAIGLLMLGWSLRG